MYHSIWAFVVLGSGFAAAKPAPLCSTVQHSCHAASVITSARSFCVSYLEATTTVTQSEVTNTATVTSGTSTAYTTGATCPTGNQKLKRENLVGQHRPTAPACLSSFASGSALSSACACIATRRKTLTVTQGPSTSTQTITVPSTITSFVLATPSCSTVSNLNAPYFSFSSQPAPQTLTFAAYYAGCGVTENVDNPADDGHFIVPLPASYDVCEATQKCSLNCAAGPNEGSWNLQHLADGSWQCLIFGGAGADPSYFNVQDPLVLESYGYSNIYDIGD